jgi:Putative bacterial sensory transduction regulator
MDKEQAFRLAVGMCEQGGVKYQIHPNGNQIRTLIGSAAVYIEVVGEGDLMSLRFIAIFVEGIKVADIDELELYKWVNTNNIKRWYGRVYVLEKEGGLVNLAVQEEILVANAQQAEFINSLHAMWAHADGLDDEAVAKFGGKTAKEVITGVG